MTSHDVVIAGAGPVGLFLGIELATAGVKPLIVERLAEPARVIKANSVGAVAAEALDRRGFGPALDIEVKAMMERFRPSLAARFGAAAAAKKPGGHFAGLFGIDQDLQRDPSRHLRMIQQEALERILSARAQELGLELRRGVSVESFEQTADGVTVQTSAGPLSTKYLVGCDGGRSTVRKLAGFDFAGTDPTLSGYQALVKLDAPEKLQQGWSRTPRGTVTLMPGGRVATTEFEAPPKDRGEPVTKEELEAAIQRMSGTDVKVLEMSMATRWTDHARQATTYRKGRVLLAGDAAHVHAPFGGQGLNLGLVDAANLGFKLARAARGDDRLLDTYTAERHPVAARVLENTRAQAALMRPDAMTSALRGIVSDLMKLPEANRYFGEMLTGVGIRYDLGDADPLVGTLPANQPVGDTTLYALMERGGGLLLSETEQPLPNGVRWAKGPGLLLRPDGCIAWTSASTVSLNDALARWF